MLPIVGLLGLITLEDDEELAPEEPFIFEKSLLTSVAGAPRHKRILIGMRTVPVAWLPSHRVVWPKFLQHLNFDVTDHCQHTTLRWCLWMASTWL